MMHPIKFFTNARSRALDKVERVFSKIKNSTGDLYQALVRDYESPEIYIVSYPNSGRTWLKVLISKALCEQFGVDERLMLDIFSLTKTARIPTVQLTHDGSQENTRVNTLIFNKEKYLGKRIILLIRDPRDVMVSYYFQQVKRGQRFQGSISEFIRSDRTGIKKALVFNQLWHKNRHFFQDFLLLSYENLSADTATCLKRVLEFIGVENPEAKAIEKAVHFASFKHMKKLEKQNSWKDFDRAQTMQLLNPEDDESYKARKGKVGGYTDYLNQNDIEYINQVIVETGYLLELYR